jgi:hypothetical protein
MHFPRHADDQGSKMREIDGLIYRLERGDPGLITLRRVEVHAEPMLKTVGW